MQYVETFCASKALATPAALLYDAAASAAAKTGVGLGEVGTCRTGRLFNVVPLVHC